MADHVCPVWVAYLLASPVRKLFQISISVSDAVRKDFRVIDSPQIARSFAVLLEKEGDIKR